MDKLRDRQCLTYRHFDISRLDLLHVDGQVSSQDCPFDHVEYSPVVLSRESAENLTPLRE